jgi:hypothetical protein
MLGIMWNSILAILNALIQARIKTLLGYFKRGDNQGNRKVNMLVRLINEHILSKVIGALMDRGANGGIAGKDTRVIFRTGMYLSLSGIDNHTVRNLELVTVVTVVKSHAGDILLVMRQFAYMPDGKTIMSPIQMEKYGCTIHDQTSRIGEKKTPYLKTPDGYMVPMRITEGLPYIDTRAPTDEEMKTLPATFVTGSEFWNPSCLDVTVPDDWYKEQSDTVKKKFLALPFDERGNVKDLDTIPVTKEGREIEPSMATTVKSVSRGSIVANLTKLIHDEMEHDFICFETRTRVVYLTVTEIDRECNWLQVNSTLRLCYAGKGRSSGPPRRSKRLAGVKAPENVPDQVTSVPNGTKVTRGSNNKAKDFTIDEENNRDRQTGPYIGVTQELDYRKLRRHFCGQSEDTIRKTVQNTTMMGVKGAIQGLRLYQHLKSPNPALNVPRRNEPVATDTIYGPTPAIDGGATAAQFFVGRKSDFCSVEASGNSDKAFPKTLMDHIRKYGAMDVLVSDSAAAQISTRVEEILRIFCIKDWQSEPHNKNQNYSERRWQDVKRMTEYLLNNVGAPANTWLLACAHVCMVLNHAASPKLGNRTPAEWLLGYTPDITPLIQFLFYEPVYYKIHETQFPDPDEGLGRFVGIADCVGNAMAFKILTGNGKIITRSVIRTATKGGPFWNARAENVAKMGVPLKPSRILKVGDQVMEVAVESDPINQKIKPARRNQTEDEGKVELRTELEELVNRGGKLPEFDIQEIIGKTFLTMPDEKGEQQRASIAEVVPEQDKAVDRDEYLLRFKCKVGEKTVEEILTYNQMLNWIEKSTVKDQYYVVDSITGHRKAKGAHGDGSKWEVHVKWASEELTWEPLNTIRECDPITIAMYAEANDLLETQGWKVSKRFTKRKQVLARMVNQAQLKNYRNKPIYKYGEQVPRNHREAMWLDETNGNNRWKEAEEKEMAQLFDYDSFKDLGKDAPVPDGHQKIPCHFVYDVKPDGRAKARFVAGGHRTTTPVDSTHSGVVSLRGIRTVTFLAELNNLELWGTDVGNAYLESYTSEKVVFTAGPEFGKLAGHTLLVVKAQYGLKTSGRCWHDKLHDILISMGFFPSKADPDIWMRDKEDHYEYIAVYVDDLMVASRKPKEITDYLTSEHVKFKLKGTGPVTFHLGCDYFRDEDGTLCVGPKRYIERCMDEYNRMFGEYPNKRMNSPMEKGDHPELDDSELLDEDGIRQYQSLIGSLQWTASLGRFDIATAVMTMSGFRVAPRVGHLNRVKRMCGFLYKFKEGCIRIRTEIPDFSDLPVPHYDWARSVYGNVKEQVPDNVPPAKGKSVRPTSYKDANLYHCMATGKAVTGVLHILNQTPWDWFTKKQATAEAATYGSEFSSARTATEQIIDIRLYLRYLGVPLLGESYLFGDNESVVKSSTIPHSLLHKRHHALSYHKVRESIASGMIRFYHLPGVLNPADILSKHWGHSCVYHELLKPMLFYRGDTMDILNEGIANAQIKEGERQDSVESSIDGNPKDNTKS